MTYTAVMLRSLKALLPDCDPDLLRLYALLAFVTGGGTTLENVHDAWALWRTATRPDHPSIVPFAELTTQVQELDRKYRDAIADVAAQHAEASA